jgi:hypothetical protein
MSDRKQAYAVYLPVIGLLAVVAFVPEVDRFVNDGVLTWGLPALSVGVSLVAALVDFRGRARRMLLLVLGVASAASLFLVGHYPSPAIIGFASALPPLLLVAALCGPKEWRRSRSCGSA